MACSIESWLHSKNVTDRCPHPAIANCAECETGLCSAHIVECKDKDCGRFICAGCEKSHQSHQTIRREPAQSRKMLGSAKKKGEMPDE